MQYFRGWFDLLPTTDLVTAVAPVLSQGTTLVKGVAYPLLRSDRGRDVATDRGRYCALEKDQQTREYAVVSLSEWYRTGGDTSQTGVRLPGHAIFSWLV